MSWASSPPIAHEDHIGAIAPLLADAQNVSHLCPALHPAILIEGKLEEDGLAAAFRVKQVRWAAPLTWVRFQMRISFPSPIRFWNPNLLAIRTRLGLIAHTGDWKIDPIPCWAEETRHHRHPESWAMKCGWRWSAIRPMPCKQGHSGSEAGCTAPAPI